MRELGPPHARAGHEPHSSTQKHDRRDSAADNEIPGSAKGEETDRGASGDESHDAEQRRSELQPLLYRRCSGPFTTASKI